MMISNRRWLYLLFFVSGFCSLVYQMVWTRLAFAAFGIITPVLSVVLSVFMLGLAVGSWAGGRTISWLTRKSGISAIFFYGFAELVIGMGAFLTPKLFALGEQCLLATGETNSFQYLLLSALVLAASILPWCVCMGATFPWMMGYVREREANPADSFSYLYFANVLGAMTGTIVTAFVFVELFGFHHTLAIAAAGNFIIAGISFLFARKSSRETPVAMPEAAAADVPSLTSPSVPVDGNLIRWILFTTGFCAMAMEVVWTRAFTPVLKTQVYSFALIVFAYLAATFFGSFLYRRHLKRNAPLSLGEMMALLGVTVFLPIIAVDPRILPAHVDPGTGNYAESTKAVIFVLLSVCPICGILGYLTPSLIDRYATGHPAAAGKAYGINVIGCILGPLCASYLLLPSLSEGHALILLGLPLFGLAVFCGQSLPMWQRMAAGTVTGAALIWCLFFAHDFEGLLKKLDPHSQVRRDYAASVVAYGEGFGRMLLVNGVGMTALTVDTKMMVHLPMSMHKGKPESALIICFGMGTSFRSALSWDVQTTVVELVPSVPASFGYYHNDAATVLANPKGRVVIDDGRRFMERTREKYDIIVVDPPPPVEAAGSSLLYSWQFYELAKEHMKTNSILQMWLPAAPKATGQAVIRSMAESFPYLRAFHSINGIHFLASMEPLESTSSEMLVGRLPVKAARDLEEWIIPSDLVGCQGCFRRVLARELPLGLMIDPDPRIEITDDQPFSEYFLLRTWRNSIKSTFVQL
jgi:spermidine synthase